MSAPVSLLPVLLLLATAAAIAQAPTDVFAHYRLQGQPATITRADVAMEMALQLRRRDRGREACGMLVDSTLIRQAAEQHGLLPSETEVREFWSQLQQQLRAAGRRPEDFAAVRNTSERQWLDDLSVQLAQERLVRRELGLGEQERVNGDMLQLWVGEARKKGSVVNDPDRLPVGIAARVGQTSVPMIELGMLLLRTSEDDERDEFVRKIAYLNALEALAQSRAITISSADLDLAVEQRRLAAQRDARFRALSFESLLEAQGLTIVSLRESRVFRAHVLLDKLAQSLFPDQKLREELAADRQAVLDLVGPRRRLGVIMIRAFDHPNAIVERDFAQAEKHLQRLRERIAKDGFAATASIESEDPDSKARGGDVGWHRRASKQLPEVVCKAAYAMQVGEVSMPLRGEQAGYLVTVLEIEPDPDEAELLSSLRQLRGQELGEQLLRDAQVELVGEAAAKSR